jgi:hypothetical protein
MSIQSGSSLGIIYVSFGDLYRDLTTLSVASLRRFGYRGPVRILTDVSEWNIDHLDCEVIAVESVGGGFGSRFYKTLVNEYGFDTTLFLDSDTLAVAPIGHVWRQLAFADLCLSIDLHPCILDLVLRGTRDRDRRREEFDYMERLGLIDDPFHSSGVMLFHRTAAVDRFFSIWHEEWNLFGHEDQLAMVRAIARTNCPIHTLAPRWNARLRPYGSIENAQRLGARILHLRPGNEPLLPEIFAEYADSGWTPNLRLEQLT